MYSCHASPQPSPKERELKKERKLTAMLFKVLSFGEDLGEATDIFDKKKNAFGVKNYVELTLF